MTFVFKDNTSFWKAWKKRFCTKNLKSASVVNGASGDEHILKESSEHFSQVGQPNTPDADYKYESVIRQFFISRSCSCDEGVKIVDTAGVHS